MMPTKPVNVITKAHIPTMEPTFTEAYMRRAWERMEAEDRLRFLFYDGATRSVDAYIDFMSDPWVHAYLVCDADTHAPLLTYFVNDFIGHTGCIHFCFFDAGQPYIAFLGSRAVSMLLSPGHLSALIGITPKPYRHAWRYALSLGFKHVTTLPDACFLAQGHRLVDAVVTICRPEDVTSPATTTINPTKEELPLGGGKKKPKVQQVQMPSAPAPAPPPEETAMAPVVLDEQASRTKNRDSKRRGTSALRIELSSGGGLGTSAGAASGLNLPRGR